MKWSGYVSDKLQFEKLINDEILNPDSLNIAYVDVETMPTYSLILIDNTMETTEEEIFTRIQEMAVTTYKIYAIKVNNEDTTFVNSRDEAKEIITKMKFNTIYTLYYTFFF